MNTANTGFPAFATKLARSFGLTPVKLDVEAWELDSPALHRDNPMKMQTQKKMLLLYIVCKRSANQGKKRLAVRCVNYIDKNAFY
jgi:hypothetical protein